MIFLLLIRGNVIYSMNVIYSIGDNTIHWPCSYTLCIVGELHRVYVGSDRSVLSDQVDHSLVCVCVCVFGGGAVGVCVCVCVRCLRTVSAYGVCVRCLRTVSAYGVCVRCLRMVSVCVNEQACETHPWMQVC